MFATRAVFMKRSDLFSIFLRSLTIQASFNFWRMQNLGFAFAMLPLICSEGEDRKRFAAALTRQMQMFNTHPYLTAPIIGSVAMIEEEGRAAEADHLKAALMGPYAGIGDAFFWGALRSFASVGASVLALSGVFLAPLAYLLLYNPAHFWVRGKGFLEGYRRGKSGIDFIRGLDLPGAAGRIRFLTLVLIGVLAAVAVETAYPSWNDLPEIPAKAAALALILLCFLGVRRGISSAKILYGMTLLCMVLSI
jgi:mannose/fructose/N-acetylgalactosamine-specific phosphotransferase system component IID